MAEIEPGEIEAGGVKKNGTSHVGEASHAGEADFVFTTGDSERAKRPLQHIGIEFSNNVAWLTMKRPPYNVLTYDMMEEMGRAISGLSGHPTVRALVLQAAPD